MHTTMIAIEIALLLAIFYTWLLMIRRYRRNRAELQDILKQARQAIAAARVYAGLPTPRPIDARRCEINGCCKYVNMLRGGAICEPHLFERSRARPIIPRC
jgi:hypothetical protein